MEETDKREDAKPKLTEWENEPSVSDLKADYTEAESSHREQADKITGWLDKLKGKSNRKKIKGKSNYEPLLIRKQAEWRYSSLSEPFLSSSELFDVDPVTYEDKESAIQNALVLNNQIETKIDKVAFIDSYVRTVVDEGTVIVRVGWEYEEGEVEESIMGVDPVVQDKIRQGLMMGELDQATAMQMLQEAPQVEIGTKTVEKAIVNQPTLEVCPYDSVIIDPTCEGNLDNAEFIIYEFETSLSELRKDGRYSNLDSIIPDDNKDEYLSAPDDGDFRFQDEPRKKMTAVEYWGYWDIDNSGIVTPIVATYIGKTMIRLEENPFPDKKLPFVIVPYMPVRNSIYGEPDGTLLAANQDTIGAVSRGMIDIMGRSANGQRGMRKDALDPVNERRFNSGQDYKFNPNIDPRQAFHMGEFPQIPNSAMEMIQMHNMEAESLTGVKSFSSGISGQALGSTATGVRSAMDATSKRELGILRRLSSGLKKIGRKIIAMNAEFLSEEEVIRITNDDFVTIRRDDLAGNFDLSISISTAESDNEKAQELSFMLQTTAQSMGNEFAQLILEDIARLRNMPSLARKIKEYKPQPDPLAIKAQELEIALLEAKVQNERAKGAENAVDVELKKAKTATEISKSRSIDSDSDLKDLEFIDKESGQSHARDMEKISTDIHGKIAGKQLDATHALDIQGMNLAQ